MTIDGRQMVAGFFRDVTERERAQADRQRLATAIEQADLAVLITNANGDIEYVNPSFSTSTGYAREEVIGRNPRMLKSGVQDDAFYRALWATLAAGKTWAGRLVNRKKDGTLFTEEASISPVRNAAGVTTSYVGVKRDITAALALEAQYLQAQKMEAVGRLAGGVAHDFNNVLSVVLSYAELIGGDLKAGDPLGEDMEEIKRAGLRAADLTRQLLSFSRRQVLERKVLDLNVQLASMENMLKRLLGADIELTILAGDRLQAIRGDPGQIEQILMNLAVNARDAMFDGGRLTIETANVELDREAVVALPEMRAGPFVRVTVTDTGVGMSEETQARIFEPFFTTKDPGRGTGLGLATVFGIVQQSKGFIRVSSAPGRGTSFELYFPPHSGAVPRASTLPTELVAQRGSETILLVEDQDDVRTVARTILRRQGYVVLDAPNAGEAFLVCEKHESDIHLLLTDVVLPRMGGRELAERLANMRPDMRMLFMSGYTDDSNMLRGILEAEVNFIQKPFTPASLARKVREVLDARR